MKEYRQISSDDEQTWKLSKETDWKAIFLSLSFVFGIILLVIFSLINS